MRAAINCARANRQILTHLVREVFAGFWPAADLRLLYDVSHITCKVERHRVDAALTAGLACKVARLTPLVCIKG